MFGGLKKLLIATAISSSVGAWVGYRIGVSHKNPAEDGIAVTTPESAPEPEADLSKDQKISVSRLLNVGYRIKIRLHHLDDRVEVVVSGSVKEAALLGITLDGFNLSEVDLAGAEMSLASLVQTDLTFVNLSRARLANANFYRTRLFSADLRDADLRGARFYDPRMTSADLRDADLRGAVFDNASLFGTDLSGADLRDADLRGADLARKNIMPSWWALLKGARYNRATKWPDGFNPEAAGAILAK